MRCLSNKEVNTNSQLRNTVFALINAPGVYSHKVPREGAFIRIEAFINLLVGLLNVSILEKEIPVPFYEISILLFR